MMSSVGEVDGVEKMGLGLKAAHGGYSLLFIGHVGGSTRPVASH